MNKMNKDSEGVIKSQLNSLPKRNHVRFSYTINLILLVVWFFVGGLASIGQCFAQSAVPVEKKIAVLPFLIGQKPDIMDSLLLCTQQQLYIEAGSLQRGAETIMTGALNRVMVKRYDYIVLSADDVRIVYEKKLRENPDASVLFLARQTGLELGSDYVLFGNVWRFKNMTGKALASESPSSVSFNLHLVDVSSGTRMWKGTFEKSQQSLSDNLFNVSDFFKQGARWLTAEELAMFGMRHILKDSPLKSHEKK